MIVLYLRMFIFGLLVQHITSTAEFREYVTDQLDFHFDCGFLKPVHLLDLSDKDQLIKAVWLHYVFFCPMLNWSS